MKRLQFIMTNGEVRRIGTTIRQIDKEIQELFTTGETTVVDHAHKFKDRLDLSKDGAQIDHLHRLFARMRVEHDMQLGIEYSYDKRTGKLKLK